MSSQSEKIHMDMQAEDGDALAGRLAADLREEERGPPAGGWALVPGRRYVVYTGMLYYRGVFYGEDHEWLVLCEAEEVYETGPLADFYSGRPTLAEAIPAKTGTGKARLVRIRRGVIAAVVDA